MTTAERRFSIAGLEVVLLSAQTRTLDALASSYAACPSHNATPDLVIEIERVPGFGRDRPRGPRYPGFETSLQGPLTIALSRFDAEGVLALPDTTASAPVRARFRVGESPNSLEAAIRVGMSVAVPRRGGLVLHASAVATAGHAAVFAGKSGAGKSTIAAMLDGLPEMRRIADELLIAMPRTPSASPSASHAWDVHIPPFLGHMPLPFGTCLPLAGVHFLAQAPHHRRMALPRADALRALLPHVLAYVAEPDTAARVLDAGAAMVAAVPCYLLEFAKNPDVARVLPVT